MSSLPSKNLNEYNRLTAWLTDNQDLKNNDEYELALNSWYRLHQLKNKPAYSNENLSEEQLINWLSNNQDLKNTPEYDYKLEKWYSLSSGETQQQKEDMGLYADAALRGTVQGATFDFADEGIAFYKAANDYFSSDDEENISFSDLYDYHWENENEILADYKKRAGKSYLAGQVAGSVATLPLGGVLGKTGAYLFGIGKTGKTATQTAFQVGAAGALQSGLHSAGATQTSDLLTTDRLTEGAKGAGVGFVLGGTLGFTGHKLSDKIANSSQGLLNRALNLTEKPVSSEELGKQVTPQLTEIARKAESKRDQSYTLWREELEKVVGKTKAVYSREPETQQLKVIPTDLLKSHVRGFKKLGDFSKNSDLTSILNADKKVTVDTFNYYLSEAWNLYKVLPDSHAAKLMTRLKTMPDYKTSVLNKIGGNLGTKRKKLDQAVRHYEEGQLLDKTLVKNIREGKPLDDVFLSKFLPKGGEGGTANLQNYINFENRIKAWSKEANLSGKEIDEILNPLRANAIHDAISNPSVFKALTDTAEKGGTTASRDTLAHFKKLLTPQQFSFVSSLSKLPPNHLEKRIQSLSQYYVARGLLGAGAGGAGAGAGALAVGASPMVSAIVGLAVLSGIYGSPILMRKLANNPSLLNLASKVINAPLGTPSTKIAKAGEALGKASIKAGVMNPETAQAMLNSIAQQLELGEKKEGAN